MLWKFLDTYQDKTGGSVLAIPHNGNLSNGRMFALVDFEGRGLTRAYAETRARLEPVYEVTQIKGDGEAHPFLSPNDEFAGYELWDKGNLDLTELKRPEMLQYEYARSGSQARPEARAGTRRQSLQVRHDRIDRLAYVAGDRRGGQFLRQALGRRAQRDARYASLPPVQRRQSQDHGLGNDRIGLRRRLVHRQYARSDLRRADAQGGLCDDRSADDRAFLRRLGLQFRRCAHAQSGRGRLRQGRADGRRPDQMRPLAKHRASSSAPSKTRSARTSIASRSSRAGRMRTAN